jgi:hypothetical protein
METELGNVKGTGNITIHIRGSKNYGIDVNYFYMSIHSSLH